MMIAMLDTFVKRIFRYLVKRLLSGYFEDFTIDELTYGVDHGKGSVEDINLSVEALNELSEEYNLPFQVLHGSIDFVSLYVPWKNLSNENIIIEVRGLNLVIQPKERPQDVSMFDSTWGSMTSSLQLAEEGLNSNEDNEEVVCPKLDRLNILTIADIIDTASRNLKIRFQDSSLKIEHILPNQTTGISLEIKIQSAEYFDDAGVNAPLKGHVEKEKTFELSVYSYKRIVFEGISLFTAEFMPEEKPFIPLHPVFNEEGIDPSRFVPGSPEMPPTHASLNIRKMEPSFNCDPVLISKLNGQQELRLKLKQNEIALGPKVDIEFNFGAFNMFLTPQQVHLLFALINGLIRPNNSSCDSSKKVHSSVTNKPMRPADYALVEQELLRQQQSPQVMSRSLKNQQGWSSHFLDESDEDFHLMPMENKASCDITPSSSSQDDLLSSMNSDTKSDCAGFVFNQKTKSKGSRVKDMLSDSQTELTHFHGCLGSVLIIILHDDSVQETFTGNGLRSDCVSLKVQAETFFSDLQDLQMSGFNFKDFASVREPISKLCETNHLRLMASGVVLDGNETSSSTERSLRFNASLHQFEILECLFNSPAPTNEAHNPNYMQLLTFPETNASSSEQKEACFKLNYSQVECMSQNRINKPPANKLDLVFSTMTCDIDISLTDRIRTLLNFSNFDDHTDNKWDCLNTDVSFRTQVSSKTEITISSCSLTLNLRFPVPDLRSIHDMERTPWWQQNVHKEILVLVLQEITLKTTYDDEALVAKYEIQSQDVHGLWKMSSSEEAISFLRVSVDPNADEVSRNTGFDWPRLVIRRMTKVASPDLECVLEEDNEMHSCSLSYALMTNLVSESSPFCSTSVVHDNKEANANLPSDHDEIIKPAEKENMLQFVEKTVNQSECVLEFTLPTVNIVLPDKDFFELICNRLGSDLVLWENTSLSSTNTYDSGGFKVHIPGLDVSYPKTQPYEHHPIFKPFVNDSNSDSEDEDTMYMSVHDYYQRYKQKYKKPLDSGLTKFSFSISITKGCLLVNTPLLDDVNMPVLDQCGKLKLNVEEGLLFFASSYKGDPNESYMCLMAEKSALFHQGSAAIEIKNSIVQPLNVLIKNNMECIIYESDPGMHVNPSCVPTFSKEMLKFAIHIVRNPKQQIKTFKIAIEISGATLQHYVVPDSQIFINQLINFIKIEDFPVKGYIPPAVVTELHLNLNNCAIDYRPFRLPYRTAVTVDNFNMSCNVTATTPAFIFRIISEELRLFISANTEAKKIYLKKHYVCVIDTGLIDILIKRSVDEKDNPTVEMSISNNKVHIRTCADSFKALLELVNYLNVKGDIETPSSTTKENENVKSYMKSKSIDSDSQNVDILMAEAMKECSIVVNGNNEKFSQNFDFDYCNTDDEFCILEDDPGVGLIPRNGEPQIRMLTDEPIKIIENHFAVPPGKSDLLKAPYYYPKPLFLLKLQETSLIWHLYGGTDLKEGVTKEHSVEAKSDANYKSKHGVTFLDQGGSDNDISVSFCKVNPVPKNFDSNTQQFSMEHVTIDQNQGSSNSEFWLHKGGPSRDHDVLVELHMSKVQFQREIYPLDNEYASRYILFIHDIEIDDRLIKSDFKKFLYQYTTQDLPRQSNANMIDITAAYLRPDPKRSTEECILEVSCKPLKLNVYQNTLMFLVKFFQEVPDVPVAECSEDGEAQENVLHTTLSPVSNLNIYESDSLECETFYKTFTFSPDVLIRIDYVGAICDIGQGGVKGLLMGIAQLNASEISLKRISYHNGLLGHKKLISYAINEWQQDIMKNQLPSLLGGVGPMHSIVQLFQGVRDLFYMPVVQYQRDGQIIRGLQRGASSFSTSTVVAVLDLASRFFYTVQGAAQLGYDVVNPGPRVSSKYQRSQEMYRKNNQPADIIEGVATAYNVVKEGLEDTARTIYRVASTEHEHKGVPGAVGGVLRQIPPCILKPIMLGSEASGYVLDGVRHQLMPDAHQEDIHKWKTKNN